jgi:phosphoribosylformylglycinamidine cyclo-ligase
VKAFAHITGGGLPGNLPRVLPDHVSAAIDLSTIKPAPVFKWLASSGSVPEAEMLRTFNCGVGFVAVASPENASQVSAAFEAQGDRIFQIGVIEARTAEGPSIRFDGHLDFGT